MWRTFPTVPFGLLTNIELLKVSFREILDAVRKDESGHYGINLGDDIPTETRGLDILNSIERPSIQAVESGDYRYLADDSSNRTLIKRPADRTPYQGVTSNRKAAHWYPVYRVAFATGRLAGSLGRHRHR